MPAITNEHFGVTVIHVK